MGKCPLITIILRAAVFGLLLWLAVAGFTKVSEEIRSMYMESSDVGSKDLDGAMRNKEKVDRIAGYRPAVDLNYASERRVPRGPDPIHNRRALSDQRVAISTSNIGIQKEQGNWFRRAGNSRQPPGQA